MTVVFFHFGGILPIPRTSPWSQIIRAGDVSVSYFFTLSGFIMAVAYFRTDGKLNVVRYAVARIARIYPLYLLSLLLIAPLVMYQGDHGKRVLLLNLALLQAWFPRYALTFNSPAWSLSVEAFFYVCFPLLLWVFARRSPRALVIIAGAFWVGSQVTHAYLLKNYYQPYPSLVHSALSFFPLIHLNAFIVGLILGILFKKFREHIQLSRFVTAGGIILSTGVICVFLAYWKVFAARLDLDVVLTNGLLAPLFGVFILFLALDQSWIARTMQQKWLVLLGEASYGIYILQEPFSQYYFYHFAPHTNWSEIIISYGFYILLIVLAVIIYRWYETPLRLWIRQLGDKLLRISFRQQFHRFPTNKKSRM